MLEIESPTIDKALREFPGLLSELMPELENLVKARVLLEVSRRRRANDPVGARAIALVNEVMEETPGAPLDDDEFMEVLERIWDQTAPKAS